MRLSVRVLLTLSAVVVTGCGTPGTPRPIDPPKPVEVSPTDHAQSAGAVTRSVLDGEPCEVVTSTSTADSYDAARSNAEAEARAALLRFQRQRVRQDLRTFIAEEQTTGAEGTRARSRQETESLLVASSEGELRNVRVLRADAARRGTGFLGTATVACPVRSLFPHERLQAALRSAETSAEALLALAAEYETEGHQLLAEQTLRWANTRGGGARAALALGHHLGRRGFEAEALRWYEIAARQTDPAGPMGAEIQARVDDIRAQVPSAADLVDQLLGVAEARQDPRFVVTADRAVRAESVDWSVRWTIRGDAERRVLRMWFDDSFTPVWWADDESVEPGPSDRAGGIKFSLRRGATRARVLFWALPVDCDLWPMLVAWRGTELKLGDGACPEAERIKLRDVLQALRRVDVAAAVMTVSGT